MKCDDMEVHKYQTMGDTMESSSLNVEHFIVGVLELYF